MRVLVMISALFLVVMATAGWDCDRYDPDAPVLNLGESEEVWPCCHEVEQPVQPGHEKCVLCD